MKRILAITKKELLVLFYSPIGYIFAGLYFLVINWLFFNDLFILGQADLSPYWNVAVYLLSLFIPAISMGLIAEEKKNSTWEMLLSLPINETELVVGKYLGGVIYLLFFWLMSLPVVITIFILGKPEFGLVMAGLIGVIILSISYLAIGLLISTISKQPIVSFLITTVFLIINSLMGQEILLSRMPLLLRDICQNLSLNYRFLNITTGLINLSDLVFFGSVIFVGLFLASILLKENHQK
ncbi:MAG TPA: ABC transporter permease subunit [Candidatus Woesebacteria bacterium]|nr:ABC transporter permease subunit [Candidatus Woesebacteria bacterium]HPJ16906.1 ABC transporter permease subunit [Candidatus Woesebacteria bacterium]